MCRKYLTDNYKKGHSSFYNTTIIMDIEHYTDL